MSDALLISVRFYEGWYHGAGGPPSPARLFQALVAGAGIGGPLDVETVKALEWLERHDCTNIGSPHVVSQKSYINYVPNNEADACKGYQENIKKAAKHIASLVFDPTIPFLFAWKLADEAAVEAAKRILPLAERVYQLGRCVDMAWAWAELLTKEELQERLHSYPGIIRHPSTGIADVNCPVPGSLKSLLQRYQAGARQFGIVDGRNQTFRQRPKPRWKKVCYEGAPTRFLLELHRSEDDNFAPWPLERASVLVQEIRDAAADKLRRALADRISDIDRVLIGRKPNGENAGPTSARVRIVPLASIGHKQADMQIRRVLVEVPPECPLQADDISWSVSGLQLIHPVLREPVHLIVSGDPSPLARFGVGNPARIWRSVTPVSLLEAQRRRLPPNRTQTEEKTTKSASERQIEHGRTAFAIGQALRHAGVAASVHSVRLQREPFNQRGVRVEPFAEGTRFNKHCLWHVELQFESPVSGPLVIGDGRFLGLGVMRPVTPAVGVYAFSIESGLQPNPNPQRLALALRRAVMARTRDAQGTPRLPSYFSGHPEDGSPGRSEEPHLAFVFDPQERQFLVVTPGQLNRLRSQLDFRDAPLLEGALAADYHASRSRIEQLDLRYAPLLEKALEGLHQLRAGKDGCLQLQPIVVDTTCHHLFQASHLWESRTPYDVNRHARKSTAEAVLMRDILGECERRGLPCPQVTILKWHAMRGLGLQGWLRLEFKQAVSGPIILGRSRHTGGGLFAPADEPQD